MNLTIVAPAYNEVEVLPLFLERTEKVCEKMVAACEINEYEIIIVDDGSMDDTWLVVEKFHHSNPNIKGLKFSRNFGHQCALKAGFDFASEGNCILSIDSDLQGQPEDIPRLIQQYNSGFQVIWGVAKKRDESFIVRLTSKLFYSFFDKLVKQKIPHDFVMVLFSPEAAGAVKHMTEYNRFNIGIWAYVGYKTILIPVEKKSRYKGEIKLRFSHRMNIAVSSIFTYSKIPLKISTYIGFFMALFSFGLGVYNLILKIFFDSQSPGYTSTILILTFFLGLIFIILGIIGEYIGIIMDEVKKRPNYFIEKKIE